MPSATEEKAASFGFLMDAYKFGAPLHGGKGLHGPGPHGHAMLKKDLNSVTSSLS